MTDILEGRMFPTSALTIAGVKDLGYTVNCYATDNYDGNLSDARRATTVENGQKVLRESQRPGDLVEDEESGLA